MKKIKVLKAFFLFLFLAGVVSAGATTRIWVTSAGTNDWFNPVNWDGGITIPGPGDDVVITNAGTGILLTNSTPYLGSLTISNRSTLIFSNWDTTLQAANVLVATGATVTCIGPFTNTVMSNNVVIICSNLMITTNGTIGVDSKGYIGGPNYNAGCGPGAGPGTDKGAGHGGVGYGGGGVYGVSNAPLCPGSGGGGASGNGPGGNGGGAIRIQVDGTVMVNGTISAGGQAGTAAHAGGGSGGSIFITCKIFSGSGGVVSANGGGNDGGGGGRIAVIYDTALQGAQPVPSVVFSTAGGGALGYGDIGTLYFPDNRFLTSTIIHSGQWSVPGFTNWSVDNLIITNNGWVRFPADGFKLIITNQLVVYGTNNAQFHRLEFVDGNVTCGGNLILNSGLLRLYSGSNYLYSALNCGGDFIMTNSSCLYVYSSMTNGSPPDYGALVNVTGNMFVYTNNWIYPYAHSTNGGSVLFQMKNLTLFPSGGFDANGKGYAGGSLSGQPAYGPGGGKTYHDGGGYGGMGGNARTGSGNTYGSSNAPIMPGSGGGGATGNGPGGNGGGAVRIYASGTFTMNGIIMAIGGVYCADSGGGSGGGIYIRCKVLDGTNGTINANGETVSSSGYAGGGGRIAIWRQKDKSAGTIQSAAAGGTGNLNGQPGTVVWGLLPPPGTVFYGR